MDNLDAQFVFSILDKLRVKYMFVDDAHLFELAQIWGNVEALIMRKIHDEVLATTVEGIHIDLKPEMATLQAHMDMFLADAIIEKRTQSRLLTDIVPKAERDFHSSLAGQKAISDTATELSTVWVEKYKERWKPKTDAKLKREASPPRPKPRTPKRVSENHFISKFFLRKFWLFDDTLTIHEKLETAVAPTTDVLGSWGWQKGLYSNKLEDRFSLIEGDAEKPLQKIMKTELLNDPERHSLLGYLIVQKLRNPFLRQRLLEGSRQAVIDWVGEDKSHEKETERRVFETLFENNELYHSIAHPLFWSRWCLLKSSENSFVLPDTAMVLEKVHEQYVLLAPLSPKVCFVCSDLPEVNADTKEALPTSISDQLLAEKVSSLLIAVSERQFLSHPDFQRPPAKQAARNELSEVIEAISEVLTPPKFLLKKTF